MWPFDTLFPRQRLTDRLPWDLAVDDRTIFTKCGGFLQVAHIEPPSLDSSSDATIDTYYNQIGALEGGLPVGWTIMHDQWRWLLDANGPLCDFGGIRAAQLINAAERRQFAGDRAYDNSVFIALHYEPAKALAGLMEWMASDDDAFSRSAELKRFREDAGKFFGELALIVPKVTMLEGPALGSYLSQTVNFEPWPAYIPGAGIDLALGRSHWKTGVDFMVDDLHVRTIELFSVGMLTADTVRMLHGLDFECRWCVRIDTTDKHEQTKWLGKMRAEYEQRRQSIPRRMMQWFSRQEEPDSNPAAAHQMAEVDQLRVDIEMGGQGFAPITMDVYVWDKDKRVANERALEVETRLKGRGFSVARAILSAVEAPLADMIGNDPQPREVPAAFAQISRLSPLTGIWRGARVDGKWNGPYLTLGYSADTGVPVRVVWHAPGEDVGNAAIIGQTGSGKSSLWAKLAAASLVYPESSVLAFDIGRAFMPACLCLEGDWIELSATQPCVQPLRHVDDPDQAILIHDWLCRVLEFQGVRRDHETDDALTQGMALVARLPVHERTMPELVARIGALITVREALRTFTAKYGAMFAGVVESYGTARVVGIECGALRNSEVLPLAVTAMFDAIRYERMRGQPCVVMFDEFHELLKRNAFKDEIDRLAREIRKHNGVMVLATQNPADMTDELAAVIDSQCPNRILTPNPDAGEPNQARFYKAIGCSPDEIRMIQTGYQKGDYYFRTRQGRAMLRIRLEDEAAAICGHSTPRDIQHCFQLLAEGRKGGEFLPAWLEYVARDQDAKEQAA